MGGYIYLDEVDSTNTYLLEGNFPEGTAVCTDNQTAGRGRGGRRWLASRGSCMALSVQLEALPVSLLMGAQMAAAYAMVDVLKDYGDIRVKWPNDLVFKGRKLAGLLIETRFAGSSLEKAVFGIGLNIKGVPGELSHRAVSLEEIYGRPVDMNILISQSLESLHLGFYRYRRGKLDIAALWPSYSANFGKTVTFHINSDTMQVTEEGITPEGRLLARLGDGSLQTVTEGEIGYDFSI